MNTWSGAYLRSYLCCISRSSLLDRPLTRSSSDLAFTADWNLLISSPTSSDKALRTASLRTMLLGTSELLLSLLLGLICCLRLRSCPLARGGSCRRVVTPVIPVHTLQGMITTKLHNKPLKHYSKYLYSLSSTLLFHMLQMIINSFITLNFSY